MYVIYSTKTTLWGILTDSGTLHSYVYLYNN